MPPPFDNWSPSHSFPQNNISTPAPPQKKPRHRHAPHQLAALNELFDQNEHPALELRVSLAERLGMEVKTVNAWFQNKRASSKKRVRGAPLHETQSINSSLTPSHPSPETIDSLRYLDHDDMQDDDYSFADMQHSRSTSVAPTDHMYGSTHGEQTQFYSESDGIPRKMRMRPSSEQTEELRKLYNLTPHPTTEQRQQLSASIGMRYQSITNWFQNQRSLAKKRKEDEDIISQNIIINNNNNNNIVNPLDSRQFSAFPPPSHHHPSLPLPPLPTPTPTPPSPPSEHTAELMDDTPPPPPPPPQRSVSPFVEDRSPRRSSSRHSGTPYGSLSANFARPRRSRPEPYQLEALKELFIKTATPTIEERSVLAFKIGMEVGKVTNWFRNLRQTARKRAKKSGSGDDDDDAFTARDLYSASVSRSGTPSLDSSSSSMMDNDEAMDMDYDHSNHSDNGSDDEDQEAVTPSPEPSPSPQSPPPEPAPRNYPPLEPSKHVSRPLSDLEQAAKQYANIRVEDALLLLSFHQTIIVH